MSSSRTTSAAGAASRTADLALIAVFTALVIVLGFVAVPVGVAGVPLLLQNTAVIMAALVLGPRRGFAVAGLFLLIGLALPVLAGGRTTIYALGSPTVGYVISYLVAVPVAGFIAARGVDKHKATAAALLVIAGFIGLAIEYVLGAVGLMLRAGLDPAAAAAAQLPFIPADAVEMAVMVAVAMGVSTAFPQLMERAPRGAGDTR